MYKKTLTFKSQHIYTDNIINCKSVIDISLKESDKGLILTIVGDTKAKDSSQTIEHSSGQNSDSLRQWFPSNDKAQRISDVWDRYANNDLRAGTPKQSTILRKSREDGESIDYDNALKILEDADLVSDDGYEYGSQWLFEEIPQSIIDEIKLEW